MTRVELPSERLSAYRNNKGLSGRAVARMCDMSVATYNRIERGHDARASSLLKLNRFLGVHLYWMLTGAHAASLSTKERS